MVEQVDLGSKGRLFKPYCPQSPIAMSLARHFELPSSRVAQLVCECKWMSQWCSEAHTGTPASVGLPRGGSRGYISSLSSPSMKEEWLNDGYILWELWASTKAQKNQFLLILVVLDVRIRAPSPHSHTLPDLTCFSLDIYKDISKDKIQLYLCFSDRCKKGIKGKKNTLSMHFIYKVEFA